MIIEKVQISTPEPANAVNIPEIEKNRAYGYEVTSQFPYIWKVLVGLIHSHVTQHGDISGLCGCADSQSARTQVVRRVRMVHTTAVSNFTE